MKFTINTEMQRFADYLHEIHKLTKPSARRYAIYLQYRHLPETNRPTAPAKTDKVDKLYGMFRAYDDAMLRPVTREITASVPEPKLIPNQELEEMQKAVKHLSEIRLLLEELVGLLK